MQCVTVKNALDRYNRTISVNKKRYQQEFWRINQLSRSFLGAMVVNKVTSEHIAQYRDERLAAVSHRTKKKISASSVRLEMNLLQNFFEICKMEWGYCKKNPCKDVRKPRSAQARERRLTGREERKILHYAHQHRNPDLYSIIVLALETAMRQGEIIGLEWEHIDLKKRVAHVSQTKNGTKRDVPLTMAAKEAILRMRERNGSKGGRPRGRIFTYTAAGIKTTWRVMCEKLEIADLNFHDLRHEAISRLFETGRLDMMEVAAISGHKNLSMLKRYTHLRASRLVKKLDGNNRNKAKLLLLAKLQPYPAVFERVNGLVQVHFPDFGYLKTEGKDPEAAEYAASALLTEVLVRAALEGQKIPVPDSYIEWFDPESIIMIEPLYSVYPLESEK